MPYATQQNMIDRFDEHELIELTDRDNTGVIDAAVLDKAIADASAMMDGYIQSRYSLPLSVVPASLERVCCDIARYYLYDEGADEAVEKRHKDAIDYLKNVASGRVSLGPAADGSEAEKSDTAQMETGGRVFGRDDSSFV